MTAAAEPWVALTGYLEAAAIGGLPTLTAQRRERIAAAASSAHALFRPHTDVQPSRHELLILAVADVIGWDRPTDDHLRLLIGAVAVERAHRAEINRIESLVPIANSPRWLKGAAE